MPNFNGNIKKLSIILLLMVALFFISSSVKAQLRQIYIDSNKDVYLQKFSMYSATEGFVAFNQFIGFTTDSGRTFSKRFVSRENVDYDGNSVNITFGFYIEGIKAFDKNNIIVYGNYGLVPAILTSSNGGNTFKLVYHSLYRTIPGSSVTDMAFAANGLTGYAVDYDHIIKTTDGGKTWKEIATYDNSRFRSVQVLADSRIFIFSAFGSQQKLLTSSDGGLNWKTITLPTSSIGAAFFLNANVGWIGNNNGNLYKTTNGGISFTLQNNSPASYIQPRKLFFEDELTGYALSDNFLLYKTTDGGNVWERLITLTQKNDQYNIFDFQLSGNQIWGGGSNGYVALSTAKGGITKPFIGFFIDESAVAGGGMVQLNNYGKSTNSYKWFKNSKLFSTAYNVNYLPNVNAPNDTIKLIVSNAKYTDSITKITTYSKAPVITGFSRGPAGVQYPVEIYGSNFKNVTSVSFGGVAPLSFKVLSETRIEAMLQKKTRSGEVKVTTANGSATRNGFVFKSPPLLKSAEPMAAIAGTKIIIRGTNFNDIEEFSLAGSDLDYTITSDTTAEFILRADARSGKIISEDDWYNSVGWDTLALFKIMPVITSVSRNRGQYRSYISITGSGIHYSDIKSITIDGYPVKSVGTYSNNYGREVNFIAGEGGDNGIIRIETIGGSYEFKDFTYYKTPQINALSSYSGAVGDVITITGNNFSGNAAEMHVYFGAVMAEIISASKTRVDVKVPAGATYEPVTVRTNNMVCYSAKPFILTFKGGGNIDQKSFGAAAYFNSLGNGNKIKVVDIDGNGKPEIAQPALTYEGRDVLRFLQNTSKPGNLAVENYTTLQRGVGEGFYYGGFTDFDNDGKFDYVTTEQIAYTHLQFDKYAMSWGIGYESDMVSRREVDRSGNVYSSIIDLDKDGNIDLVNGHAGDLNGDGYQDVVAYDYGSVIIKRNIGIKGRTEYVETITMNVAGGVYDIALGDLDEDNLPDLVVGGRDNGVLRVYKNTSTLNKISFAEVLKYDAENKKSSVEVELGDMDGDGLVDIVLANGGVLQIYKNKSKVGDINFVASFSRPGLSGCLIADMDGDGRVDIVSNGVLLRNLINTPQITSFTPQGGAKDQTVTITGGDFTGTTAVAFGGVNAKSFKVNSANSITAVTDSAASGYIAVTTPQGTGNSLIHFKFLTNPKISTSDKATFFKGDSATLVTMLDGSYTYQWAKNGIAVSGANTYFYRAKESGNYTVTISYGNSDKLTSEPFTVRAYIKIPGNNFHLSTTGIACRGKKDGTLSVSADATMNYIANINGTNYPFTKNLALNNLEAGTYRVCITIANEEAFSQCFTVEVTQPANFFAMAAVNALRDSVRLSLNGGDVYFISINGDRISTKDSNITLPLKATLNTIAVTTDKECQGVYTELINGSTKIQAYPNPFVDELNVNIGTELIKVVSISITDMQTGAKVLEQNFFNQRASVKLDTRQLAAKIYVLTVLLDGKKYVYKITK